MWVTVSYSGGRGGDVLMYSGEERLLKIKPACMMCCLYKVTWVCMETCA